MNSVICPEKFLLAPAIDRTTQDLDVGFAPRNPPSSILVTAEASPDPHIFPGKLPCQSSIGGSRSGRGWQGCGGCPEPWPLGYKQWAQRCFQRMWCLPNLSSGDWCRIMSPTAFSDFFPILFQCFITAGFYRHYSFQKYWN